MPCNLLGPGVGKLWPTGPSSLQHLSINNVTNNVYWDTATSVHFSTVYPALTLQQQFSSCGKVHVTCKVWNVYFQPFPESLPTSVLSAEIRALRKAEERSLSSWSLQKWKRDHEQINVTSCNNITSAVPVSPGVPGTQRPTRGPGVLSRSLSEQGRLTVTSGGSLQPLSAWRFLSPLLPSPLCFLGGEAPSSDPWSSPHSEPSSWPPHRMVQHGPPGLYFPLTHR